MLLNGQLVGRNLEVGIKQMNRIAPRIIGILQIKKKDTSAAFSFTV